MTNSPAARPRPWLLPAVLAVATLGAVGMTPRPAVPAETITWGYLALTAVVALQAAAGALPLQNRLVVVLVVASLGAFATWLPAPGETATSGAVGGALAWICAASLGRGGARWLLQGRRHRPVYGLELLGLGASLAAYLHWLLGDSAGLAASPWPSALASTSHLPAWLCLTATTLEALLILVAAAPWFIDKRAHPAPPTPAPLLLFIGLSALAIALPSRADRSAMSMVQLVPLAFLALVGQSIKPAAGPLSHPERWQPAIEG